MHRFIILIFSAAKSKLSHYFHLYQIINAPCIKYILLFGWKWFHCFLLLCFPPLIRANLKNEAYILPIICECFPLHNAFHSSSFVSICLLVVLWFTLSVSYINTMDLWCKESARHDMKRSLKVTFSLRLECVHLTLSTARCYSREDDGKRSANTVE